MLAPLSCPEFRREVSLRRVRKSGTRHSLSGGHVAEWSDLRSRTNLAYDWIPVLSVVGPGVAGVLMKKLEERTTADMEVALEQVCRVLPHGGEHKKRKRITRKLMHSARHGKTSLGDS
jgi:hypothetical protein